MIRRVARGGALALAVVCAAGGWLFAQQAPPQQPPQRPPVFRAGANFVLVDAYPVANGRFVEGLTGADFQVLENGRPQVVDQFEFIRVEPSPESDRPDPRTQAEALEQAADPHNRVFIAYLDIYHTNVTGSHSTRRPLVDLLEQVLAPRDLFAATTPRQRPQDIVFGRKTTSLEKQLEENWIWGLRQSYEREPAEQALEGCFKFFDYTVDGRQRFVNDGVLTNVKLGDLLTARHREDKLLTHLEDLIRYLGSVREARKVVLIFTNGWLLYRPDQPTLERVLKVFIDEIGPPPLPGVGVAGGKMVMAERTDLPGTPTCIAQFTHLFMLDNERRMRDLVTDANRRNVTFYPVNPSGIEIFDRGAHEMRLSDNPGAMIQDMNRVTFRSDALLTLAHNTDGLAVITNDLRGGLKKIVDDVSAYYVLGYYSTNKNFDGAYRRIEVKVAKPGVQVRARRGYFAPKAGAMSAAETPKPAAAPAPPAGLTEALGVLSRLRTGVELYAQAVIDEAEARVGVELGSVPLAGWAQGGEVQVTATSLDGATVGSGAGRIDAGARGAVVVVPLTGASGPVSFRVTAKAGTSATLNARVEARANPSTLLGDALVFRAMPAGTSPLRPAADGQFRRTERVHVEWPIRGALDRRDARLLNRTGQPIAVPVTVTEREAGGRRVLAADVLPAPLADGDYVIELTAATGGGDPERRYVAIRVVR